MKIVLLHNPDAGEGEHSTDRLVREIHDAGHEVAQVVHKRKELVTALSFAADFDLVVAAGGDGTVDKAALALRGSPVPLAVLPLGTANNVARTLGHTLPIADLVRAWADWRAVPFDVVIGDVDGCSFVEAFGVGVFPRLMKTADAEPPPPDREVRLARDHALFREAVAVAEPQHCSIELDGVDCSGDYLMVELHNVPFLGPRVALAPGAATNDGQLDVVLVRDDDRGAVLDYLDGVRRPLSLPRHLARQVVLRDLSGLWHCDGALLEQPLPRVELQVDPAAVRVLAPRR